MITINLLPPQNIKDLKLTRLHSFLFRRVLALSIFGILVLALLLGADFLLRHNLKILEGDLERKKSASAASGFSALEGKIDQFNNNLEKIAALQSQHIRFSPFLVELTRLTPPEVRIIRLQVQKDGGGVEIQGVAKTRDSLLRFQKNLAESAFFKDIESPLSNLESREDVDFQLKFKIKEEYLD
ncbi:MAG: PilN domain-containing protein [Candidatus Doudnabacteria bacterium]